MPGLAIKYLQQAAERGRNTAMAELGKFYFFAVGVEKDRRVGEEWIRKAAWLGAVGPMMDLADWWENPAYVGTADRAKAQALYYEVGELGARNARTLLRKRASEGDRDAEKYMHLDLVVISMRGYDALPTQLRNAVKWLESNVAADDQQVQLALANVMKERELVVYDPEKAREKATRLAAAGNDDARALLAEMAWRGIGEKTNPEAAIAIWRELAAKGNAIALSQLGRLHWWGDGEKYGVPKDATKTFEYCRRSATLGYWAGQLDVAECYAHGIGVQKNYFLAAKYYGILEDRRYKDAHRMKERILAMVKD
jgi:TPR repeat protein